MDGRRPPGPSLSGFWRSPLRGEWLASVLSAALLPLIAICAVTGVLSQAAYQPDLGRNSPLPDGGLGIDLVPFGWPTSPAWLYAVTQGLHVLSGLAAIPILLAKLWAVIPKLFQWPPFRSPAHALERASLALLVGGSLFVLFTGVANIQVYRPWRFSFVPAHAYASIVFVGALALHVALKLGVMRQAFREEGVVEPLRRGDEAQIPRRAFLASVAAGSGALLLLSAGQVIGGPLRRIALLAPRGAGTAGSGPNDFPINKTAAAVGLRPQDLGPQWRLTVRGARELRLSRGELLALPQHTERLPIACVEGWSTTQDWTGVRLRDLARLAGLDKADEALVESLQGVGAFRQATLGGPQVRDARSLLALKVNGADLSPDHGFPGRVIVPALPGVHCTKWVKAVTFRERA